MKTIVVKLTLEKEVEIDIVKEISKYNPAVKWNIISDLLNDFSKSDINFIAKHKREVLAKYLQHQSKRFQE